MFKFHFKLKKYGCNNHFAKIDFHHVFASDYGSRNKKHVAILLEYSSKSIQVPHYIRTHKFSSPTLDEFDDAPMHARVCRGRHVPSVGLCKVLVLNYANIPLSIVHVLHMNETRWVNRFQISPKSSNEKTNPTQGIGPVSCHAVWIWDNSCECFFTFFRFYSVSVSSSREFIVFAHFVCIFICTFCKNSCIQLRDNVYLV